MNNDGVVWVVGHIIFSLAVLIAYVICAYLHLSEQSTLLGTALTVIVGYWFGAMSNQKMSKAKGDGSNNG